MPIIGNLRKELSKNSSGKVYNIDKIPILKEKNYFIENITLDGDAPKQFIKAYFFEKDGRIRKSFPKTWNAYIAKTAEKWYPHESIMEFMINRIGQCIGLYMNEIKLVKANGQIRFLSKYFLSNDTDENSLILVHGAEICGQYLNDTILAKQIAENKQSARELFTFEFIKDSIRNVFPTNFDEITLNLVKMIIFDAIVGNQDRHFYNWGVITTKHKSEKLPTFAPIFDSARGLYWNQSDENIKHILNVHNSGGMQVINYIKKACPRISLEENYEASHFELLKYVKNYNPEYARIINVLTCTKIEEKIIKLLREEFSGYFIPERLILIEFVLRERLKIIRNI